MKPLILASASPQRRTLLENLGLPFTVDVSTVDESACAESDPRRRSVVLARLKAQEVATRHRSAFVIGCDTLVVSPDGTLHEKPRDADEARDMIRRQSGGESVVHSGLCVVSPEGGEVSDVSSSVVQFRKLSDADIEWWIRTGLWEGRSGAFQIDGKGQLMIEKMTGDWSGVVGLPVFLLGKLLEESGYAWRQ